MSKLTIGRPFVIHYLAISDKSVLPCWKYRLSTNVFMNIYVYMGGDATTVIAFKEVGAAHYNAVKSVLATTVKRLYHRQLILTTDIPTVD